MNRKILGLLTAFAAMGAMSNDNYSPTYKKTWEALTDDERREIKRIREENAKKRNLQRGLNWFEKDGFGVYALNQENADRKIEKMKKQLLELE